MANNILAKISPLKVLEDKREIDKAQDLFEKNLKKVSERTEMMWVTYKGGRDKLSGSWNKKLGIWWIHSTSSGNRYWNAFGIGEPKWGTNHGHNITCEINPPFKGIDRKIAGVFAKDSEGKLFLLHRGKIGGGRPGNGKTKFKREFRGNWIDVEDGSVTSQLALVAAFESSRFSEQVADFVYQVRRMKDDTFVNKPVLNSTDEGLEHCFTEEFEGIKKYNITNRAIEAACDHGLIVNSLARLFENDGITVRSNLQIDLFTVSNNDIKSLFEIKTDASSTNIYGAIGQLFYHSAHIGKNCRLVAVFPENIDDNSKKTFKKLNVTYLTYNWVDGKPHFTGFNPKSFI